MQECIDSNNAKVTEYRANMPGCGLRLLVVTGIATRGAVWSKVLEDQVYSTSFDRVFCIDAYENRTFELRTRPLESLAPQ